MRSEQNDINGVLLIDKPEGITSAGVVRALKKRLHPKKIGHGGTLDPIATGLLVILLGRGTKLSSRFLEGEKRYTGAFSLGIGTDTDDITGTVIERDEELEEHVPPSRLAELEKEIERSFTGTLAQIPPAYSAIKVDGERSYDLARKGQAPELVAREVKISELRVSFDGPQRLRYDVTCSKGTYVRSLARDIGRFLGTCGTVETLRREAVCGLEVSRALPLEAVTLESYGQAFLRVEELGEQKSRDLAEGSL